MVNFTTINNTGQTTRATRKTARRATNASNEATTRHQHVLERRGHIDRRMAKGEKRIMDRRNMSSRRSTINLTV